MNKKTLVYEFTGLPGSGKTTVTKEVIHCLGREGIRTPSYEYLREQRSFKFTHAGQLIKYLLFFLFCLKKWKVSLQLARYMLKIKPLSRDRVKFTVAFLRTYYFIDSLLKKKADHDVIVLEEGLVQNIWGMFISGHPPDSTELKPILQRVCQVLPISVVHVNVDVQTAIQRIQQRTYGAGRFDKIEITEAERLLNVHEKHLQEIIGLILSLDCHLFTIDGKAEIGEKVMTIVKDIKKQIRQHAG